MAKKAKIFIFALILLLIVIIFFIVKISVNTYNIQAYPKTYSEYVERFSAEYNLDENFIYAIIKTESGFNPTAVSEDDAKGLMQFTAPTFDWVSRKMGILDKYTHDDLFTPEISIEYGCFLVRYLLDEFGTYPEVLAAYHAGRGAVNTWLDNPEYSEDSKTLKTTPYKDTNHYMSKVLKNFDKYTELSGK